MQRRISAVARRSTDSHAVLREANFYALPFAPQMLVWAIRRRLTALGGGRKDDDVLHVFHMADWAALYDTLLALVDTLVGACADRLVLHATGCPCLALHEACLLNALAHLQKDRREEALLSLCELIPPAGVRLAMPHLDKIAASLRAQNLHFVHIDMATLTAPARRAPRQGGVDHVH